MKQITGINHVGLRVRDLRTARGFYEKLGFEFIVGPIRPTKFILMNTVGVQNPDLAEKRSWHERALLAVLRRRVPPHRDNADLWNTWKFRMPVIMNQVA